MKGIWEDGSVSGAEAVHWKHQRAPSGLARRWGGKEVGAWEVVGQGPAERILWNQTNLSLSAQVSHFSSLNLSSPS